MDQSIVAVEDNHRNSDIVASPSKPLGSLIQINSITIDISCAMEEIEESPMHEHFSIRGFVAGIRKKDWKVCLPFESNDDNVLMDNLPPLSIAKSRWWRCSHCVPDIVDKRTALETPLANRNDASTSSCPEVDGEKDGLLLLDVQRRGDQHEPRDFGNEEEDSSPNNKMIIYNVRSIEGHKATTSSREKADAPDNEGGNTHARTTEANPLQIRERHQNSADASDIARVDEVDNASSGSEGAFNVPACRRKRKLRSLADIMYEEKNSTGEHSRMRSASSSGTQVKSTEVEADLDPQVHLDVSADVTKSIKSPLKKRKSNVEEGRGLSETTSPTSTGKRSKGTIPDAEKMSRRLEASDSESEGNASVRLDVRHNAKTQQTKPKKNKALDISKKTRQNHTDNRTVQTREVSKITSVHSANLQKHAITSDTDFRKTGGGVLSVVGGGKEPYFTSFPSEKQVDRISYLSKGKRPAVEGNDSPLMPPGKSMFGDCNIQGEVALELSLNSSVGTERKTDNHISFRQHSSIPDLNESFTEKASVMQGKPLPTVSEKRSLIPNRTLEMLASCSKGAAREGKGKPGITKPQDVQNINSSRESGGISDDIPMEIVELLAKNQRERALGNSRQHILCEGIHSSIREPPPVYLDGRPSSFNFPARSSVSFVSNGMGVTRGLLNFPQAKNCRLDTGNLDNGQFRLFSSFTPNRQRKTQYPAPNTVMSGPRSGEGSDLLWPPRSKNVPFHLSVAPNCSIQPNTLGVQPFPDHCYKGKPINDFKGKGKIIRDASAMNDGHKSLDAYSNDTIPAMQLLSLMDRGIASSPSFKVGKHCFLDKPFSPCSHHPRVNGSENQNSPFLNTPTFSQSKNFPGLLNGVCFPSESLNKPYSRGQMSQEQGQSKAMQFQGLSKAVIQPLRDNIPLGICTLNRNPADFTILDASNEYTLTAKDLIKPRKRSALKERPHLANMQGQKRQRPRKDASGKDLSRK